MTEWWAGISQFEKIFWFCALPASVLLLFQLILSFIGLEHGDADVSGSGMDFDHDFSVDIHDGDVNVDLHAESSSGHIGGVFRFFTVKSVIYFFVGFGWAGIAALKSGTSNASAVISALVSGILFSGVIFYVMYLLSKLSSSGNVSIANAVDKIGTVYLPIKANKSGLGMIQVSIQGSLREVQAQTEDQEDLKTGEKVRIISIIDGSTVLVKHA